MEKQTYKKLEICLITLANEDVITASFGEGNEPTGVNELEPDFGDMF